MVLVLVATGPVLPTSLLVPTVLRDQAGMVQVLHPLSTRTHMATPQLLALVALSLLEAVVMVSGEMGNILLALPTPVWSVSFSGS